MPTREILIDLLNDSFEGLIDGNGRLLARPTSPRMCRTEHVAAHAAVHVVIPERMGA